MSAVAPARNEDLLQLLDAALGAYQCGNSDAFSHAVDALVEWRSRTVHTVLSRVAQELSDSLSAVSSLAQRDPHLTQDLPDARSRLDYVVQMTERAAHRTLDCVDNCRRRVDTLTKQPLPISSVPTLDAMRLDLSEIAQAQEYQDLSGQIIRRVIGIVLRVEQALDEIGAHTNASRRAEDGLAGPAVPAVDVTSVSQTDADALLAGLGL